MESNTSFPELYISKINELKGQEVKGNCKFRENFRRYDISVGRITAYNEAIKTFIETYQEWVRKYSQEEEPSIDEADGMANSGEAATGD